MRKLILVCLLLIIISRIQAYANNKCNGCNYSFATRITEPLESKFGSYQFRKQTVLIKCDQRQCLSMLDEVKVGQKISVTGKLKLDIKESNKNWQLINPTINLIPIKQDLIYRYISYLYNLQQSLVSVYRQALDDPYAGLIAGIVWGYRAELPEIFYDALIRTGTLHVVAASGYNVAIIANIALHLFLLKMQRKYAIIAALISVIIYVGLAGASPPVIRAGIMAAIAFLAQLWGREYLASWGLLLTGAAMIIISPWLVFDVSFQLSFAATAGMIWGIQPIMTLLQKISFNKYRLNTNINKWLNEANQVLATTLAATITTLPLTVVHFNRISIISPLVNLLIAFLIAPIMSLGLLAAIGGLMVPVWGNVFSWLAYPWLWVFVNIVEYFATTPGSTVELQGANWFIALSWWCLISAWWLSERSVNRKNM